MREYVHAMLMFFRRLLRSVVQVCRAIGARLFRRLHSQLATAGGDEADDSENEADME